MVSRFSQEWDLRRPDQIEECLRHSDIVYNLVGREYETKYVLFLVAWPSPDTGSLPIGTSHTTTFTPRVPMQLQPLLRRTVLIASCMFLTLTRRTTPRLHSTAPRPRVRSS